VSICSVCQAALEVLQTIRASFLVHHCQKALNIISALHAVGLYWVSGHAGVRGNELTDGLARCGSASSFVGSEPALGDPRQDLRNRINCWLVNKL
jgi:ribonuclease HI